ncbi:MAG: hypothetical protein H7X97_06720, partial [Opitutaceae bacterium]|nr:hypothetical protein [Verrucomicrobiales bacterium]
MRNQFILLASLISVLGFSGCGTYDRHGLDPVRARQIQQELIPGKPTLTRELEDKILALNSEAVTARDVAEVLSRAPAPQIIKIHGGLASVIDEMVSFSDFLQGMGYPGASLTNAGDGTVTFSCYESSEMIAGVIAWYYEQGGLRPMMVGHSQGGIQAIKVLHQLAGHFAPRIHVYNPLTWQREERDQFVDPLTGASRPVVGLTLPYVSSVGAGGLTRVLPNQWEMNFKLRTIPDTVEEFTGFCKRYDILGGDYLGYGPANHSGASGVAMVRNVWLPTEYDHGRIPDTKHLLRNQEMKDWINDYRASNEPVVYLKLDAVFTGDSRHILWAADVWSRIKKHWVLELQRLIRARRSQNH